MNRISRIARHRWYDETDARRVLSCEALMRIEARVVASERRHSGEIRVCVEAGLPWPELWRDVSPRQRALALFGQLGIWDTEHNNGVLIYLLLAERRIEIVADRGIHRRVDVVHWPTVVEAMAAALRAGAFEAAVVQAIDRVDAVLAAHFPLPAGERHANELPDAPVLLI